MKKPNIQIEDLLSESNIHISHDKIMQLIQGKVIFITGGAGSIGSEMCNLLAKFNPKQLIVLDQAETPLHSLTLHFEKHWPLVNFSPILCDITNKAKLKTLFKTFKPHIIYHCAAYKHVPLMEKNPCEAVLVNIMGTKILAELAIEHEVKKFTFISTDKAVNPTNIMGASKRIAELYLKWLASLNHKTQFITTRFGNVLGSNGSVFSLFKNQIEEGGPITITHPDMQRYLMSIPNACKLIAETSLIGKNGETFVFDMGDPIKIQDLAKGMINLFGLIPEKDIKIKIIGQRPGEKLNEEMTHVMAKVSPTSNNKIMLVKEDINLLNDFKNDVDDLITLAKNYNSSQTITNIWEVINKYESKNLPITKKE